MHEQRPTIRRDPIEWEILPEFYPQYGRVSGGIHVVRKLRPDGAAWYAVIVRSSFALSRDGTLDYEPMPSSRTDEYLLQHRWDRWEDAVAVAEIYAEQCLAGEDE